ncbi:DNA-3-methyladenine glycosylase 2 family protein [Modicisalibacter xianhensis]|uniref:DNA-3-methyladenine glycosylase II n=1 Tax=Modicisalibacter xianhensis TaxID=442341 RepID=A0A1I2YN59_9GAMM|nr:AlkA N-terminal domain-containing protein [Halomonas xianhensis]SFH26940.1 DNA-3-methyladenine glycosylase II [Halomonas xianhensis]
MLDRDVCRRARLARDARFDGQFFTAVRTTGIYCRPICPATPPQEGNVDYYPSAIEAARAGYRPCLRCRPDSAPGSPAWKGTDTTLERALRLIDAGALQDASLDRLCSRLGIGDRYLRALFQRRFGVSPKAYARYQQCLFAKQLLHQTRLPVTDIAYASGFRSLRRFNACFREYMGMAPSQLRRQAGTTTGGLTLHLAYRPPYAWPVMQRFLARRRIDGLEWIGDDHYGRSFTWQHTKGCFTAIHDPRRHGFRVTLELDDLSVMQPVVANIRRILDLDADTRAIETHLAGAAPGLPLIEGLRLPGTWSLFEAGVRAILGQQVSIDAAKRHVQMLVETLGPGFADSAGEQRRHFPGPESIAENELAFLRMPGARRETLRRFAAWYRDAPKVDDPAHWLALKGIGPWTVDYARLRGTSHPDIWLAGDLGVKQALGALESESRIDPQAAAPWRSYLTLQLWNR